MRGTTQLGGRILPLECARRGTSANSRPVIQRMHFGRFAPSTDSLVFKIAHPTAGRSPFDYEDSIM